MSNLTAAARTDTFSSSTSFMAKSRDSTLHCLLTGVLAMALEPFFSSKLCGGAYLQQINKVSNRNDKRTIPLPAALPLPGSGNQAIIYRKWAVCDWMK